MVATIHQVSGPKVSLTSGGETIRVPLPPVEVGIGHGLPLRGARTAQMKVLRERVDGRSLRLELEGMADSESVLQVRRNDASARLTCDGGELDGGRLKVRFGDGAGYVTKVVTLRW